MKAISKRWKSGRPFMAAALFLALVVTSGRTQGTRPGASRNLLLWDTGAPVENKVGPEDRTGWNFVPDDLLQLENDPSKASSDPGYYGRAYVFKGDAVVETPRLAAVFCTAKGCVQIYAKQVSIGKESGSNAADWSARKAVELLPCRPDGASSNISQIEIVQNSDDAIVLEVSFSPGAPKLRGRFAFDRTGTVEVRPIENMNRVQLSGPIEYGVAPEFIGDDLIFSSQRCGTNTVGMPCENLFLGLLAGESTELVITWPKGNQRLNLRMQDNPVENWINFENDSKSFYLTVLSARGLWHKEVLNPDYLERDVRIAWQRPFPAKWKTELNEEDLKTTFAFRESKGEIWRGVAGSYVYPVWFDGEEAYYHLSKKVAPEGESIIYCIEGRDTPLSVSTPVDILKQTLGRQAAESMMDIESRKLRTHHRRAALGVRRACTCGCTEAIQALFEAGDEVNQKDYIQGALDDMIYFVHCHVERINAYRQFADRMLKMIRDKKQASPDLKSYLDGLEEIAQQIPQEYDVQKENMKDFAYADGLSGKTMGLTAKRDPNNLNEYMQLLKAWRAMGGAQDYVLAKCHVITRSLAQAAGYDCAGLPGAVAVAQEIRERCRQILSNPDGYEIWADY